MRSEIWVYMDRYSSLNIWGSELSRSPIATASFWSFAIGSNKPGWERVKGELSNATLLLLHRSLSAQTLCFPLTNVDRFHILRNETLLPVKIYNASKMCILFNLNFHDFYALRLFYVFITGIYTENWFWCQWWFYWSQSILIIKTHSMSWTCRICPYNKTNQMH